MTTATRKRKSSIPPHVRAQKRVVKPQVNVKAVAEDKPVPPTWKRAPTPLQYLKEKTRMWCPKAGGWVYQLPRQAGVETKKVCLELAQVFCQDALLQEVLG